MDVRNKKSGDNGSFLIIVFDDQNEKESFFKAVDICIGHFTREEDKRHMIDIRDILLSRCEPSPYDEGRDSTILFQENLLQLFCICYDMIYMIYSDNYVITQLQANIEVCASEIQRLEMKK